MSEINIGQFAEALNTKADTDLRNIDTNKCDMVIEYQEPTAENNYTWYRLYATGWVEQGGRVQSTSTDYGEQTVIFPVTMADIGYTVTVTPESSYNNTMEAKGFSFSHPTTTSMRLYPQVQSLTWGNYWKVEGRADMTGHEILPNPSQNLILEMVKAIYPVGSLYIGTQNTCPMSTIISGSTWELVSSGKALWTGNGTAGSGTTTNANYANAPANTTIGAGLPDHIHTYNFPAVVEGGSPGDTDWRKTGATTKMETNGVKDTSIYGKSSTVQPPAYVVNVWRRTA